MNEVTPDDIIELFAPALGEDKARSVVQAALSALQLPTSGMPAPRALLVLEHIAEEPGLVGITARFAKSRVILAWGGAPRRTGS